MQGALARARTDHRAQAWSAWMTAALGRMKGMPSLAEIIGEDPGQAEKPRQTPEQQLAILTAWAARNAG